MEHISSIVVAESRKAGTELTDIMMHLEKAKHLAYSETQADLLNAALALRPIAGTNSWGSPFTDQQQDELAKKYYEVLMSL